MDTRFKMLLPLLLLTLPAVVQAQFNYTTNTGRITAYNASGASDEPTYNGLPLSYWLRDFQLYRSDTPHPLTDEAKTAVAHIGIVAIPFLLDRIRQGQSAGFDESGPVEAFRVLGPTAWSAIPELARLATNQPESGPMSAYSAVLALGGIGPDALPVLLTVLTNTTLQERRIGAIEAIGGIGTNALPALPALLGCLHDKDDIVAMFAIGAVGVVGVRQQVALTALEDILQGSRPGLRSAALYALSNFGKESVPALMRASTDTNSGIRNTARFHLKHVAPEELTNATALAIAAAGLRSSDPDRRSYAAEILKRAGRQAGVPSYDPMGPEGHFDPLFWNATNAIRHLAPQLLTNEPPH
jgi:hypothetical protein